MDINNPGSYHGCILQGYFKFPGRGIFREEESSQDGLYYFVGAYIIIPFSHGMEIQGICELHKHGRSIL